MLSLWSQETLHDFILRDKNLIQDSVLAVVWLSHGSSSKVWQANFLCSNFVAFVNRTPNGVNWKLRRSYRWSNKKALWGERINSLSTLNINCRDETFPKSRAHSGGKRASWPGGHPAWKLFPVVDSWRKCTTLSWRETGRNCLPFSVFLCITLAPSFFFTPLSTSAAVSLSLSPPHNLMRLSSLWVLCVFVWGNRWHSAPAHLLAETCN